MKKYVVTVTMHYDDIIHGKGTRICHEFPFVNEANAENYCAELTATYANMNDAEYQYRVSVTEKETTIPAIDSSIQSDDMYVIAFVSERDYGYDEEDEQIVIVGKDKALNAFDMLVYNNNEDHEKYGFYKYDGICLLEGVVCSNSGYVVGINTVMEWVSPEYKQYLDADERYYETTGNAWDV